MCPSNPLRVGLQGTSVLVPINQSVRFFSLPLPLTNLLSPAALTGVACLQNKLRASLLGCYFAPSAPESSSLLVTRGPSASPHSCVRTYDPCTWSWICSVQLLCAWFPNSAALLNSLEPYGKKLVESFGRGIGWGRHLLALCSVDPRFHPSTTYVPEHHWVLPRFLIIPEARTH